MNSSDIIMLLGGWRVGLQVQWNQLCPFKAFGGWAYIPCLDVHFFASGIIMWNNILILILSG